MASLNYTFPGALPSAWGSPISPPQLSPMPSKLPHACSCEPTQPVGGLSLLSLEVIGPVVPRERHLVMVTGPAVCRHSHSQFDFLSYWGSGSGLPCPPKFPVYDVSISETHQPHAVAPHPSDDHPLHSMARSPLAVTMNSVLSLRGEVGPGRSELLTPFSFPCPGAGKLEASLGRGHPHSS